MKPVVPFGFVAAMATLVASGVLLFGCSLKPTPFPATKPDEKHWLVKNVCTTPSSQYMEKDTFDHNINPVINVLFTPRNEKNHYVAETMWIDPMGQEYRTIRTTHDIVRENQKSIAPRSRDGTPRTHTMPTTELYEHKPGLWKVKLFIDRELARILEFSVR